MTNKMNIRPLIAALSLILIFSVGAFAQKKDDCAQMTDEAIVSAIYAKLRVKYSGQLSHINVRSTGKVVTIEGWATTKSVKKDIEKLAKKVKCAKSIVNNLTVGIGGGCGPGQKQCGDICISERETCNICRPSAGNSCGGTDKN